MFAKEPDLSAKMPNVSIKEPYASLKTSYTLSMCLLRVDLRERWGAGVETQKNVRGEIGGWGRVPFNELHAPSFSTIYDGA